MEEEGTRENAEESDRPEDPKGSQEPTEHKDDSEKTAEELEEGEGTVDSGDDARQSLSHTTDQAADAVEPLQEGGTVSLGFADIPVRTLVAIALFVVVFTVVWMLLWTALGGLGLALGPLAAAVAAGFAVKLYADRERDR